MPLKHHKSASYIYLSISKHKLALELIISIYLFENKQYRYNDMYGFKKQNIDIIMLVFEG